MIQQVLIHFINQVGVMRTLWVEPEDCRLTCGAGTIHCQFDPVTYWQVFGLTHSPDITLCNLVFHQQGAFSADDTNGTCGFNFEGFVMRTIFFGFLRH